MYKILFGILFFLTVSQGVWAQNDALEDALADTLSGVVVPTFDDNESDENVEEEAAEEVEYVEEYAEVKEEEFNLRKVDKEEWEALKKDKRFQYRKEVKEKEREYKPRPTPWLDGIGKFFSSAFFKMLLYIFLGSFLIFIGYLFVKNNNISFRRNIKDEEVVQEAPWEDVTRFADWELALQKAMAAEDYRLATRIYYLHTLNILDKNNVIQYREDKTNWYYVQKLFGSPLHDDFKELTRSFDYIWYGEYQVDAEQFDVLAMQFKSFKIQISE